MSSPVDNRLEWFLDRFHEDINYLNDRMADYVRAKHGNDYLAVDFQYFNDVLTCVVLAPDGTRSYDTATLDELKLIAVSPSPQVEISNDAATVRDLLDEYGISLDEARVAIQAVAAIKVVAGGNL